MNRFDRLLDKFQLPVGSPFVDLYLDWGSAVTKVLLGGGSTLTRRTCLLEHPQTGSILTLGEKATSYGFETNESMKVVKPIANGVITNTNQATQFLRIVLDELLRDVNNPFFSRIRGRCLYPSSASKLEKKLLTKVLDDVGVGRWRIVSKSEAYRALLRRDSHAHGCGGVVDLGSDTTEITLLDEDNQLRSTTILFGMSRYLDQITQTVKQSYSSLISKKTAANIFEQVGGLTRDELTTEANPQLRIAVRSKNIITGRPDTITVESEPIQDQFELLNQELVENIRLFFSTTPTSLLTSSLDRGLYVTGWGANLKSITATLEEKLQLELITSPRPESDLVRGLSLYVKS